MVIVCTDVLVTSCRETSVLDSSRDHARLHVPLDLVRREVAETSRY